MKKMRGFVVKNLHQSWCVVWLEIGVIGGVVLGLVFRINYFASGWFLALVGILLTISYLWPRVIWMVLAFLAGMILSFWRVSGELSGTEYIMRLHGEKVVVTGEIGADPETDEKGTNFKLINLRFGDGCDDSGECVATRGSLYVSEYKNEKLAWGDTVVLSGNLSEGFGTYAGYMYRPQIKKWRRPEPGNWVLTLRNFFADRIKKNIPDPQVRLGLSYLLGMKSGLPDDLSEKLRVVGLTHIVVASGAHLSILVEIAKKMFGKMSRFAGLIFSVIFILVFMAMVGWTPSILRAGVMSILTLIGWYVGRKISPMRMILMVAAGTLMIDPMFVENLGWMLSFASFAGIMILGPKFTRYFYGEKKPGFVAETVITTIAATVMTLPVVLYYYGQVSLISVVANLLILPTLPYAMGLVFLAGITAGIPGVEVAVGFVATKLLDFHIAVVSFFGEMEQFLIKIEPYQIWVFLIYLVVGGVLGVGLFRKKMIKLREVK